MKKLYYLGAMAGLILTSCANDDLVNDPGTNPVPNDGAIAFNMRLNNQTRVGVGLEGTYTNFGVFAFKTTEGKPMSSITEVTGENMSDQVVMDNYRVNFVDNVEFYGSHWTYVSDQWSTNDENLTQYLKYWDGSYTNTYFFPYAPYNKLQTFANTAAEATLTFAEMQMDENVENDFVYADVTKVTNADYIDPGNGPIGNPKKVQLQFRRGASKVKIAFHENIPGYKVVLEKVKFDGEAETAGVAAIPADKGASWSRGKYVNKATPVVTYKAADDYTSTISFTKGETANDNIIFSLPGNDDAANEVSTDHANPTALPSVYTVVPNNGTTKIGDDNDQEVDNSGLQFVVNYKLVSEDTKEVIHVKGARVYVTPTYTAWAPNTIYTYLFLITRTSSGTTTTTEPTNNPEEPQDALYPIIFDGVQIANMETNNSEWILNGLQLSETNVTLDVDGKKKLTASVDGTPCPNVLWGTNNSNIATVSNEGEITAVGAGVTVITAKVTDSSGVEYTATCVVSVKGIKLTGDATDAMNVDDTVTLGVTKIAVTGDVTWESSDTNVATVENGEVTAVAAGTATITATLGSYTATREVTVQ